jgi:hypothetical protein
MDVPTAIPIWITWPIVFSSLIGCSFILEEAVNPKVRKILYVIPRQTDRSGQSRAMTKDDALRSARRSARVDELDGVARVQPQSRRRCGRLGGVCS